MVQSPSSETDIRLASQEIPLLLNPKLHYRFHEIPPLVPILRQMNPIHNYPAFFSKTHF